MVCETCGKVLRKGALFCGKCGMKIPIKCLSCGTVRDDEDDMFCYKCGKQLPETPVSGDEGGSTSKSPQPAPKPAPVAKQKEEDSHDASLKSVKQEKTEPVASAKPKPEPESVPEESKGWKLTTGKGLLDFYDTFSYKTGFVIEEEEPVGGGGLFTLKAHQSKIVIWDDKQNGIKLEGFNKEGKRVSFWVNIQKNGSNDVQHSVGGVDKVVLDQLDGIYTYIEYYNPKLITAIERVYTKYCA